MREVIVRYFDNGSGNVRGKMVGELVRCKECKEWDKNDHECYLDRGGLYFPNADDFCSYGEREGE